MIEGCQYAVEIMPDAEGKPFLAFVVLTSLTRNEFYLCRPTDNYQKIADTIRNGILQAGQEARRMNTGLVVATAGDLPNGYRSKEGRQQHRARTKS